MREKYSRGRKNAGRKEGGNFKWGDQNRLNKKTSEQRHPSEVGSQADMGGEGQGGRALSRQRDNERRVNNTEDFGVYSE